MGRVAVREGATCPLLSSVTEEASSSVPASREAPAGLWGVVASEEAWWWSDSGAWLISGCVFSGANAIPEEVAVPGADAIPGEPEAPPWGGEEGGVEGCWWWSSGSPRCPREASGESSVSSSMPGGDGRSLACLFYPVVKR